MRFSTHLADTTPFIRVLASIEHLQKRIVVHANQDEVRLVVCPLVDGDKSDSCPVEAYVRISVKDDKSVFSEYMIESKRDNNIYFVIDVKALSQAFKGVDKGPVRLKLTRKNANNYLSLRSESGPNSICQDVPIEYVYITTHRISQHCHHLPYPCIATIIYCWSFHIVNILILLIYLLLSMDIVTDHAV